MHVLNVTDHTHPLVKRLTDNAKEVLAYAALRTSAPVEIADLIAALREQQNSLAAILLHAARKRPHARPPQRARETPLRAMLTHKKPNVALSAEAVRFLAGAAKIAWQHGAHYIGTEHFLARYLEEPGTKELSGHDRMTLKEELATLLHAAENARNAGPGHSPLPLHDTLEREPLIPPPYHPHEHRESPNAERRNVNSGMPRERIAAAKIVERFCEDLTRKAALGGLDAPIEREDDLARLMKTLMRRTKNNPILIGEPGVGKTALVHGLAMKLCRGEAPPVLAGKRIYALDVGMLLGGTVWRGEFEDRLGGIIRELGRTGDILFIDEIHTIVGAGAAPGMLDAANLIKPALARGELRFIGATTPEEFRRSIEKDGALERRFQALFLAEETPQRTEAILKALAPKLEAWHSVSISPAALSRIVELAQYGFPERFLPDKAIDLLEETMAHVALTQNGNVRAAPRDALYGNPEENLSALEYQLEKALLEDRFNKAAEYASRLGTRVTQRREHPQPIPRASRPLITAADAEEVFEELSAMLAPQKIRDLSYAANIAETLKKKVVGQDRAIATLSRVLLRSAHRLSTFAKPRASFLFAGPAASGKTTLALALAETLSPGYERNGGAGIIRYRMGEFSEPHSVSRFIGSPPGYVGFEESSELIQHARRHPRSVILFEEIEKAHPRVQTLIRSLLDQGTLCGQDGSCADFRSAIVILTTGAASAFGNRIGFEEKNTDPRAQAADGKNLKTILKEDISSAVDAIVFLRTLAFDDFTRIAEGALAELANAMRQNYPPLSLTYDTEAVARRIAQLVAAKNGDARDITPLIEEHINEPLARVRMENPASRSFRVLLRNNEFVVTIYEGRAANSINCA